VSLLGKIAATIMGLQVVAGAAMLGIGMFADGLAMPDYCTWAWDCVLWGGALIAAAGIELMVVCVGALLVGVWTGLPIREYISEHGK